MTRKSKRPPQRPRSARDRQVIRAFLSRARSAAEAQLSSAEAIPVTDRVSARLADGSIQGHRRTISILDMLLHQVRDKRSEEGTDGNV